MASQSTAGDMQNRKHDHDDNCHQAKQLDPARGRRRSGVVFRARRCEAFHGRRAAGTSFVTGAGFRLPAAPIQSEVVSSAYF